MSDELDALRKRAAQTPVKMMPSDVGVLLVLVQNVPGTPVVDVTYETSIVKPASLLREIADALETT